MLTLSPTHAPPNSDSRSTASEARPIGVLLVDDHPAVRLGVRALINDQPDMRVIAESLNARDALDEVTPTVDVAVVDYHLGESRDGLWLTTRLKRLHHASPRVLIYSAFADAALAVAALIAGADGLLGKHELGEELCRAIRRLARGRHRLPAISTTVAKVMRGQLEPRDHAIFGMLLHGVDSGEVAERLGITVNELQARREAMLRSLSPARDPAAFRPGSRAPLDYERPIRRRSGWPA
jgi:DNA-binding NarL/FixJ family response regulator